MPSSLYLSSFLRKGVPFLLSAYTMRRTSSPSLSRVSVYRFPPLVYWCVFSVRKSCIPSGITDILAVSSCISKGLHCVSWWMVL